MIENVALLVLVMALGAAVLVAVLRVFIYLLGIMND